jgi:hypothetical protein
MFNLQKYVPMLAASGAVLDFLAGLLARSSGFPFRPVSWSFPFRRCAMMIDMPKGKQENKIQKTQIAC